MGLLRLLLALAVVLDHSAQPGRFMDTGAQAVQVFFMISGFYMALILSGKYGTAQAGLKKFYLNRALRLFPTYYAVLAGTILWQIACLWAARGHSLPAVAPAIASFAAENVNRLGWFPNYTLVGLDVSYFFDAAGHGLILHGAGAAAPGNYWLHGLVWVGQMWSVAAELWFYLMAPSLVRASAGRLWLVIASSLALQITLRTLGLAELAYFFWPAQIYLFALGVAAHRIYAAQYTPRISLRTWTGWGALAAAILGLTCIPLTGIHPSEWVLQIAAACLIPVLFHLTKNASWDRLVGNLSYPIYCAHLLVWEWAKTLIGRLHLSYGLLAPITVAGSLVCGLLLYYGVDHLVERVRLRIAPKRNAGPAATF